MTVIELLKQQNELLIKQNESLIQVLKAFASKDINIHVVNNSYNGSCAYADNNSKTTSGADADSSNNADTKGTNITMGKDNTIA